MPATVLTSVEVVVQEGIGCDEQAVYIADGPVEFRTVEDHEGHRVGVFVCFVPKNGYGKGRLAMVPFDHVVAIRERL
jgi:hypothetical protein